MKKTSSVKKEEFFSAVPGFLATLKEIAKKGFFGSLNVQVGGFEGAIDSVSVQGRGYIPSDKKDAVIGITPLVNVKDVFLKLQSQVKRNQLTVTGISSEVKNNNWPLWDAAGEHIIGQRGTDIQFNFSATFGK